VKPALLIGATALLAASVLMVRGNSCGHDFDFHLLSWMEVARAWHSGVIWPHWVHDANYGAGEPRLIFYPPASWLLGALLGLVTNWHVAPVLFVLLALLGAGSSMYLLAREWAGQQAATLAACLYVANPYALFVTYERGAYGELLAMAWLPYAVLFTLRHQPSTAALGLSMAALWLTNSPAAVIGSYFVALLALGMWIAERNPWPAFRAAGGVALGLGLAAFYIVPAAYEQRWVQIARAIGPGMRVEDSFLFAHTSNDFHDHVLHRASWILVSEMAVAALLAFLAWKKQADGNARKVLTATLPVIFFLQLPMSDFLWQVAPHMKFLQFPWRWIMALAIVGCALAAMVHFSGKTRAAGAVVVALLAVGAGLRFFQVCDDEDNVWAQVTAFHTGEGTEGTDEYQPAGADNSTVQQHLPLVRVLRGPQDDTTASVNGENPEWQAANASTVASTIDATMNARHTSGEAWVIQVTTPQAGFAVLRLMDYPAWQVTLDEQLLTALPSRPDGLMTVPLTAGHHTIRVQWMTTRDVFIGRFVSTMALIALLAVILLEHQKRQI
jgi:hypothetical protein